MNVGREVTAVPGIRNVGTPREDTAVLISVPQVTNLLVMAHVWVSNTYDYHM